ncbi:MAG: FixH family protein [Syntrophaceae bacterium]
MKKIILLIMAAVVIAGIAYAKDNDYRKKAGPYDVTISFDRAPSAGRNDITVRVKDTGGKDVTDAGVVVEYSMAAMPGMAPMTYKADAVRKGGSYQARINLSMAGPWTVNTKITKDGKTQSAKINIDAR